MVALAAGVGAVTGVTAGRTERLAAAITDAVLHALVAALGTASASLRTGGDGERGDAHATAAAGAFAHLPELAFGALFGGGAGMTDGHVAPIGS